MEQTVQKNQVILTYNRMLGLPVIHISHELKQEIRGGLTVQYIQQLREEYKIPKRIPFSNLTSIGFGFNDTFTCGDPTETHSRYLFSPKPICAITSQTCCECSSIDSAKEGCIYCEGSGKKLRKDAMVGLRLAASLQALFDQAAMCLKDVQIPLHITFRKTQTGYNIKGHLAERLVRYFQKPIEHYVCKCVTFAMSSMYMKLWQTYTRDCPTAESVKAYQEHQSFALTIADKSMLLFSKPTADADIVTFESHGVKTPLELLVYFSGLAMLSNTLHYNR